MDGNEILMKYNEKLILNSLKKEIEQKGNIIYTNNISLSDFDNIFIRYNGNIDKFVIYASLVFYEDFIKLTNDSLDYEEITNPEHLKTEYIISTGVKPNKDLYIIDIIKTHNLENDAIMIPKSGNIKISNSFVIRYNNE